MPEVILPCPAWACQGELIESKQDGENFYIECTECGMRGPVEPDPYHAQQSWNWLPRALRWTHELPKVAGTFFVRDIRYKEEAGLVHISSQQAARLLDKGPSPFIQYAGPIPAPIEP